MMFIRLLRYSAMLFVCAFAVPVVKASAEPVRQGSWNHARSDDDLEDGVQTIAGMLLIGGVGFAAGKSHRRSKPWKPPGDASEERNNSGED